MRLMPTNAKSSAGYNSYGVAIIGFNTRAMWSQAITSARALSHRGIANHRLASSSKTAHATIASAQNGNGIAERLERNIYLGYYGNNGITLELVSNNIVAGNYVGTTLTGNARMAMATTVSKSQATHSIIELAPDGNGNGFDANERNVIAVTTASMCIWPSMLAAQSSP